MKLSNAIRDAIVDAVLKDVFAARDTEQTANEHQLGDAVYVHFFGKYENVLYSLPEGFFPETPDADFRIGDNYHMSRISMSRVRRVSQRAYHGVFGILDDNDPLVAMYRTLQAEQKCLGDAKKQLKETTRQLVYSVTTDKALLELWSEGEKYIPKSAPPATPKNLPTVSTTELNALIAQYKSGGAA